MPQVSSDSVLAGQQTANSNQGSKRYRRRANMDDTVRKGGYGQCLKEEEKKEEGRASITKGMRFETLNISLTQETEESDEDMGFGLFD
jgi:hypothetical protein